jgi:hypothetical protein
VSSPNRRPGGNAALAKKAAATEFPARTPGKWETIIFPAGRPFSRKIESRDPFAARAGRRVAARA